MKHLKSNKISPPVLNKNPSKKLIMRMSSIDIMCASSEEEFFYEKDGSPVPEGEPVGFDIDQGSHIEFVLFSDIYWGIALES